MTINPNEPILHLMAIERIGPYDSNSEPQRPINPDNFYSPYPDRAYAIYMINGALSQGEIDDCKLFEIIATTTSVFFEENQDLLGQKLDNSTFIELDANNDRMLVLPVDDDIDELVVDRDEPDESHKVVTFTKNEDENSDASSTFERIIGLRQIPKSEKGDRIEIAYVTLEEETTSTVKITKLLQLIRQANGDVTSEENSYFEELKKADSTLTVIRKNSNLLSEQGKKDLIISLRDHLQNAPISGQLN